MKAARAAAAMAALSLLGGACARGADQGTVRTCFNTIGVKEPDADGLGSIQGWLNVAKQAKDESKDPRLLKAADAVAIALSPAVQADGFTKAERERYAAAAKQVLKACNDAKAFEGDPRKPL